MLDDSGLAPWHRNTTSCFAGDDENSLRVLELLKDNIHLSAPLSLMSQYTPNPSMATHPLLGRRLKRSEYETVVNAAMNLGFETIFTQDVDERDMAPDFDKKDPFNWEGINQVRAGSMNEFFNLGKIMVILGLVIIAVGLLVMFSGKIPLLGRLPGDITIEGKNYKFYFPLATSILISLILSLIFYFINRK